MPKRMVIDESYIRYWFKQKFDSARMPAKKPKNRLCSSRYPEIENRFEIGITEKTTTIEIVAKDNSLPEGIPSDRMILPDEFMDMIDGIGFTYDLSDN